MKYLRESIGPFFFVCALCGAYFLLFLHVGDVLDVTAPMVGNVEPMLALSCMGLAAYIAATVSYVVKATYGKAPWSLAAGTVLGLAYLAVFFWFISMGLVSGAYTPEGLIAVAGAVIAAFFGISLTTVCALMLVDRLRENASTTGLASMEPSFSSLSN